MLRIIIIVVTLLFCSITNIFGRVTNNDAQSSDSIADTISLSEVVILQKLVKHSIKKDVYTISSQIRERSYGVLDVLKNLPGINIDNLSQQITVRMDNRVVILVDGMERPKEYIQSLTSDQIEKIEILNVLPQKYNIAGMRYGINIITQNIMGYNVNLQNFMIFSPSNNGANDIANIQPHANYIFTGKKIKFNMGYGYANIHWNYPIYYERSIVGDIDKISQKVSPKSPNEYSTQRINNMNIGLDYSWNQKNLIYLRSTFSHVNESLFDKILFYNAFSANSPLLESEYYGYADKYNEFKQTLGYNGKFNRKIEFSVDLNYNYKRNAVRDVYENQTYSSLNRYINNKRFLQGNVDLNYVFNKGITLNGGYTFMWNKYLSTLSNEVLSRNIFRRHDFFSYIDANLKDILSIHAGLKFEYFANQSLLQNAHYTEILPTIQLSYMPHENIQIAGNFDMRMIYPIQSQLSEINYQIGDNIWSKGVSTLKPMKISTYSLQLTLWDNLMFGVGCEHNKNFISNVYRQEPSGISRTMVNDNLHKWSFMAMYDWQISNSLSFENSINVELSNLHSDIGAQKYTNVILDSQLKWFVKKFNFTASFEYSKGLVRNPLSQGYNETGQDLWEVSLHKSFFKKRLNIFLDYCPPIRFLKHDVQRTVINTPFYKDVQSLNLHTYDNLVLLRVTFNLHRGMSGKIKHIEEKFINEEKRGRGLF